MSEPRLEDISDYDTLKGSKKRVVWAVIFAGLFMGLVYVVIYGMYSNESDSIEINDTIKTITLK